MSTRPAAGCFALAVMPAEKTVIRCNSGGNMPITEDQLKAVLGNSQVQDFARQLGLPVDATLKILAQYLPELVDKASPNGTLQSHRT